MQNNEGIIQLHKIIKQISNDAINYDKGLGTFGIGVVNNQLELQTDVVQYILKPSEYLVNKDLLEHECEVEWSGQYIVDIKSKVKKRFKPGTYLICFLDNIPIVLTELVRGDQTG